MYNLPPEIINSILYFSDIDTCLLHGYYKDLHNKIDMNLICYALMKKDKKFYNYLVQNLYKPDSRSLVYAIHMNDINIVKEVLFNIQSREYLYHKITYIQICELNNYNEILEYLENEL